MEQTDTTLDIGALNEKIKNESAFIDILSMEMNKVIVWAKTIWSNVLLIGFAWRGDIFLLEGVPGLAKKLWR